jgi:hypothetical protein
LYAAMDGEMVTRPPPDVPVLRPDVRDMPHGSPHATHLHIATGNRGSGHDDRNHRLHRFGLGSLDVHDKDMRILRIIAILSNVAFIAYGALGWLAPILFLHALLLPLNVIRLKELHRRRAGAP